MVIEWERMGRGRSADDVEWLRNFIASRDGLPGRTSLDTMARMDAVERAARIAVDKRIRLMDSGELDAAIAEVVEEAKLPQGRQGKTMDSAENYKWREQGGVPEPRQPGPLNRAQELITSLRALEDSLEQTYGLLLGFPETGQEGLKPKLPSGESLDAMLHEAGTRAALLVGFATGMLNRLRQ